VMQDTFFKGLFVFFAAFLILFTLVPFLYPAGTFVHLDGSPSLMDHDWSPYGAGGLLYALGDLLCHQETARSFVFNGNQMPICIRDVGLLAGLVAGLFSCTLFKEKLSDKRYLIVGFVLLLLTLAEWCIENMTGADPQALRFVIAIISGIGAAWIVGFAVYRSAGREALR